MIWLLDTNTIIHALNGVAPIRDRLNAIPEGDRIAASTIAIAELIYGAECSARREENRRNIREKLQRIEAVPVTLAIAARFGVVKAQLRSFATTARHYARTEAIESAVQERVLEKFTVVHEKAEGSSQTAKRPATA